MAGWFAGANEDWTHVLCERMSTLLERSSFLQQLDCSSSTRIYVETKRSTNNSVRRCCLRVMWFNRQHPILTFSPSRRTFKDIITFIPVVIILIIPLSPVGHVLVFGAIQRFFPDFFPSCFTEQRQNLLELYETTEFSEFTINETLGVSAVGSRI